LPFAEVVNGGVQKFRRGRAPIPSSWLASRCTGPKN